MDYGHCASGSNPNQADIYPPDSSEIAHRQQEINEPTMQPGDADSPAVIVKGHSCYRTQNHHV